tara:strand:+ start:24259 stop:24834 length:576 start_codon:yes stop_codon:yes gene_type:complete
MKVYIEAGANNGIFQSRSLGHVNDEEYFGILIEALPNVTEQCRRNRETKNCIVINSALVSFDYPDDTVEINLHRRHTAMASVRDLDKNEYPNKIRVKAATLTDILTNLKIDKVDAFYLDVEGYELEVLKGIDFSKISVDKIEVEAHYNIKGINTTRDEAIKTHVDYLAPMGYNYKIVSEAGQHDKIVFTKK